MTRCWTRGHRWGRWSEPAVYTTLTVRGATVLDTDAHARQARTCQACGKTVTRFVAGWWRGP